MKPLVADEPGRRARKCFFWCSLIEYHRQCVSLPSVLDWGADVLLEREVVSLWGRCGRVFDGTPLHAPRLRLHLKSS